MSHQPTGPDDRETSSTPPGSSLRTPQRISSQTRRPSRGSDTLRRELSPLQPVLERPAGPLVGVQSILNPFPASATIYQRSSRADQVAQQSAASSTSSFRERLSATAETSRPALYGQGTSHYRQAEIQRPGPYDGGGHRPKTAGRWSPSSILPTASSSHPSGGYAGAQFQNAPPAFTFGNQPQRPGEPSTYPVPTSQWQAGQRGKDSSQTSGDRPATSPMITRPDDQPRYMTLQTQDGPVSVPLNTQTASKVADEKRKRNAGASARFRRRRKDKERDSSTAIDALKQRLDDAEEDRDFYRRERDHLASVLYNSPERARHFPRPPSPRHFRRSPQPVGQSQTSSPGSSTNYQDPRSRDPQSATSSGRTTGESHTSTPIAPQQPIQSRYGYPQVAGQNLRYMQLPQFFPPGCQQYGQPAQQQAYQPAGYQQQYAPHQSQPTPGSQLPLQTMAFPPEQGYQQQQRPQQPQQSQQPNQPQPPNQRPDLWPR